MRTIKQSTAYNLMVLMSDSTDHVSGKTGLTLTIMASKAGGAFGSIAPTVTERGDGWYSLALTSSHTDTLGDLALHVTGSGADPTDVVMQVRANVLGDTLPSNMLQVSGDATAADNLESYLDGSEFMPVDAHAPHFDVTGTTLTVKKPDGTTTAYTKTVTTDPTADPITGAS